MFCPSFILLKKKKKCLQLFCPNWISPIGYWGCLPRGKPDATESRYLTYGACWVFKCFYNPPKSDMDCGIFNVRTNVNACDCTQGCTDIARESALKVDSGRKIPCRTGGSNLLRKSAGPMLYHLSYTPARNQNIDLHTFPTSKNYFSPLVSAFFSRLLFFPPRLYLTLVGGCLAQ